MIFGIILVFTLIILLISKKFLACDNEQYLTLKLLLIFFISCIGLYYHSLPIPIGFLLFYILLKPQVNKKAKFFTAILGLIVFIFSSYLFYYNYNKMIIVKASTGSVFTSSQLQDWNNIVTAIGRPKGCKIGNYFLQYKNDGTIKELSFQIIGYNQGSLVVYQVYMFPDNHIYKMRKQNVRQWINYDKLVDGQLFFKMLDQIKFKKLHPIGVYDFFQLTTNGEITSGMNSNFKNYLISTNLIKEINGAKNSFNGLYIYFYGMKKIKESRSATAYEGVYQKVICVGWE